MSADAGPNGPPTGSGSGTLQRRLLLSYLLVLAVSIVAIVLSVRAVAPPLFDRMLDDHMGPRRMMSQMTAEMRQDTLVVFRRTLFRSLIVASLIATAVALLASTAISSRITAPITRMVDVSRRVARGDYRARVPIDDDEPSEITALATSFNEMAAALEMTERRRVHLIGDVAHEIRTPLTTLRGNLEGMLDGVIDPTPELLGQLYDETARLNRLIDDLQELSRVESGDVPLQIRPVTAGSIIETAVARLARAFEAREVAVHTLEERPDLTVMADEDRAVQVLTNLLSNALRHTPGGGNVTITTRTIGDMVEIEVRDTGSGISPEHLPYIFDRFYRADSSRSRSLGGSGIGLTIARALIEAHGGTIRAESPGPAQGTTIAIILPAAGSASPES